MGLSAGARMSWAPLGLREVAGIGLHSEVGNGIRVLQGSVTASCLLAQDGQRDCIDKDMQHPCLVHGGATSA